MSVAVGWNQATNTAYGTYTLSVAVGWKQATYTACGTYTLGRLVKFYCPDYQMFDNFPLELILLREILQLKAT